MWTHTEPTQGRVLFLGCSAIRLRYKYSFKCLSIYSVEITFIFPSLSVKSDIFTNLGLENKETGLLV